LAIYSIQRDLDIYLCLILVLTDGTAKPDMELRVDCRVVMDGTSKMTVKHNLATVFTFSHNSFNKVV